MSDSTNPIYREAPETYFPVPPALELAKAIRVDDVPAIDQIFTKYPQLDPNLEGKKGTTFLLWAYAHHHIASINALVAHGADLNRQLHLADARIQGGIDSTHLLNIATEGSEDKLFRALLDLGANPNVKDYRKVPALQNAIYINRYDRMKILIDHGADLEAGDSGGDTAAVLLAQLGYFEMVYYLLERGADWHKGNDAIAFRVQESAVGNQESVAWQIKVKHWLIAHGVQFPVRTSGAEQYRSITSQWEKTPEGHAWRERLDALGRQPDIVGRPWVELENEAFAAMEAWMAREGIPDPPL